MPLESGGENCCQKQPWEGDDSFFFFFFFLTTMVMMMLVGVRF